jgi:hypothetical protein
MRKILLKNAKYVFLVAAPVFTLSCAPVKTSGKVQQGTVQNLSADIKDPKKARASASEISKQKASEGSTYLAPSFTLGLVQADYAEIVRCDSSFKPKTTTGKLVTDIITSSDPNRTDLLEFAFNNIKGQTSYCRTVSLGSASDKFIDISAPAGTFYYIINPCVDKESSTDKRKFCSFELVFTKEHTNATTLSQEALEVAAELASEEGELYAGFSKLKEYSDVIKEKKENCEVNWVHKELGRSFWNGVLKIGSSVAGAAANSILFGSGVVASKMINTVGGLLIGAPQSTPNCPELAAEISGMQKAGEKIQELTKAVVQKRNKLNSYNAQFEKIDVTILEGFKPASPAP